MATIQFPDATNLPDGYTFEAENGVTYTLDKSGGGGWTAYNSEGFDDRYVEVNGDTMTGDLTVPNLASNNSITAGDRASTGDWLISPTTGVRYNSGSSEEIILSTDGSITAANIIKVSSASTSADAKLAIFGNANNSTNYGKVVVDGKGLYVGTDVNTPASDANITLSQDGSINAKALKIVASSGEDLVNLQTTGQNIFYRPTNSPGAAVISAKSDVNGTETGIFELAANGQLSARKTSIDPIGSERRIKENIELIDPASAWETIKSTPYYSYNYIGTDPSDVSYGPIVDEVPAEMIIQPMEENDVGVMVARSDEEGPIRTFDNGMLQARLYTALQTALTRIEALEVEVQGLKNPPQSPATADI